MNYARAVRPLTDYQISTLQALGGYRFLIVPQIARIIGTNRKYFSAHILPGLDTERIPLVGRIKYRVSRQYGRRHELFYLTEHGAFALSEIFGRPVDSYRTAAPRHAIERDFAHRVAYIDVCIGFREWVAARQGAELLRFVDYFDRVALDLRAGAWRRGFTSKTRTHIDAERYIEPDGITLFSDGGRLRLFAIEMHMDRPPGEIVRQLENHVDAIQRGTLPALYGCRESNLVLSVHENPETLKKVSAHVLKASSFSGYLPAFAFATLEGIRTDFANAWKKADGSPSRVFT